MDLEEALLGAPCTLTRDEVAERAGVPLDAAQAVWAAMGFAEVPSGEAAFTELDVEALKTAVRLRESGIVDSDTLLVLARTMGQGLARLAEAQIGVFTGQAASMSPEEALAAAAAAAEEALPGLEQLMVHVWRRQFAAATERSLTSLVDQGHPTLAVGFVDLVGFTQTSRESDAHALSLLLERFERETSLRVTAYGGRVIKMLGDEVLFVTDDVTGAAEVALATVEAHAQDQALPEVRAGVALGPVLTRLGDVFGEPVNLASRLTTEARPGTVLVDLAAASRLREDGSYSVVPLKHRSVRGYRNLRPHALRRAT